MYDVDIIMSSASSKDDKRKPDIWDIPFQHQWEEMPVDMIHMHKRLIEITGKERRNGFTDDKGPWQTRMGSDTDEIDVFDPVYADALNHLYDLFRMKPRRHFRDYSSIFLMILDLRIC